MTYWFGILNLVGIKTEFIPIYQAIVEFQVIVLIINIVGDGVKFLVGLEYMSCLSYKAKHSHTKSISRVHISLSATQHKIQSITGHLLLDQDLHQVDVSTCCCCMQWCPQFIVLCIDIGPMIQEKLNYLFIVVYAALLKNWTQQS